MNALKQKCRPKHQVLVLKCYPRTSKGAVDFKPNSSELSYLLFYATSRRSKIHKIGAFLEKKTASDVWRMRIGNVQVTLGILAALIDKSPKDLSLIAPYVLKVLDLILRSNDITMTESSLPTFEAFCDHHDASSLFADRTYFLQYRSIVHSYAQLASTQRVPAKGPVSRPVLMRWRNAGLEAIRCVSSSEALSSVIGRQIDIIVPVIIDNVYAGFDNLDVLLDRIQADDKSHTEKMALRRTSGSTFKMTETAGETNPLALSGTALDVDKIAEEDLGALALRCLKSIFMVPNRTQIHAATVVLLKFVSDKMHQDEAAATVEIGTDHDMGWAIKVFGVIARWAPVQDRYVILLAALDLMLKTPLKDESLRRHQALAAMIESLLRSDINLIGLSVMDVVLGLARQIKKVFQLPDAPDVDVGSQSEGMTEVGKEHSTESRCAKLIAQLENCIGDLATHVYYADQISDMILALVGRLQPGPSPWSATPAPCGEGTDGKGSGRTASSTVDLTETQSPAGAPPPCGKLRTSTLRVIKSILVVANARTSHGDNLNLARNRVPARVWEGTQWLLREPDGRVRKAYVDVLVTWLERETTALDARAVDEAAAAARRVSVRNSGGREPSQARRVVSNASQRERQSRVWRCHFLPLLHMAMYDSAHQFVDFDSDVVLLHSLLTKLVFKLGVNAARCGVPMIYRLQEDVQELEQPIHKVRIAALCHGYFWALSERFNFESSVGGRAIQNEIARRKSKRFWIEGIQVPPRLLRQIGRPGRPGPDPEWDLAALETEELLPFDDRTSLVHCIATSYQESSSGASAPESPGASSGRQASPPATSANGSAPWMEESAELPDVFREAMLSEWSKEGAMAALLESKTESLSGSRVGTTGTNPHRLTVLSTSINGPGHYLSPSPYGSMVNLGPNSSQGQGERLSAMLRRRKASMQDGVSPSTSVSSKGGVASVEQLKMVLTGRMSPQMMRMSGVDDESDESMLSYDLSPSERSLSPTVREEQLAKAGESLGRPTSASESLKGPLTSNPPFEGEAGLDGGGGTEQDVPPVPPIPRLMSLARGGIVPQGGIAVHDYATKRANSSRWGESAPSQPPRSRDGSSRGMDLQELLRGIDSRAGDSNLGHLAKPPY